MTQFVNGLTTFDSSLTTFDSGLTTLAKLNKPHRLDVENWCGIVESQADEIHPPQTQAIA